MNFWLAVVAGWIVPGSGNVWHVQNWTPPRAGLRGQKPSHGSCINICLAEPLGRLGDGRMSTPRGLAINADL